ncbi:hypothetical protein Thimo_0781 [Thioflavicoccus mobilis 8321]|uniref:Phage protein n=1 Tax=Thioflavicoccus mobilis 8321 TaxID=765912 RepID=L0GW65_9GAMM|nr:hypothetical protein [Thioflavicoccus mobilis]AGA89620.1 hypothetical protein Thimo_0781 [Thioflavicoccus mobilis 8321]
MLGDSDLLALWERGSPRHPLDRALLLGCWARPDLAPDALADLPLGTLNRALLGLRTDLFGRAIDAYVDCEVCGARHALALDAEDFSAAAAGSDAPGEGRVAGRRWRAPTIRDLAAVAGEPSPQAAAFAILHRCLSPPPTPAELADLLVEADAVFEASDPGAEIGLALICDACGHRWVANFDIAALLWDEVAARARALLDEVDRLARAYGWSEAEILGLSPVRRAAYLELVSG